MRRICLALAVIAASSQAQEPVRDALDLQKARNALVADFGKQRYYPKDQFVLDDLPAYVPETTVSGEIRIWGSDLFGGAAMKRMLEEGFRKYHPKTSFSFVLKGPALATAGLLTGAADIGPSRRITWDALLAFQRVFDHDPLVINGMTGWSVDPPLAIVVNKSNPLAKLTMAQLDGIFGAERNGGWVGTTWHPEFARGPEKNIRSWGQLGLTGDWKDKPINVYGYGLRYLFAPRFSDDVLKSSDKWNEHLQQFINFATPEGKLKSADQQMADAVAKDPYGIAYYSNMRGISENTKIIALAAENGPFVPPDAANVRTHVYPLFDMMYFYLNREPGKPLDPKLREFMRYILSREGQQAVVDDGTMLPLTKAQLLDERRKLD